MKILHMSYKELINYVKENYNKNYSIEDEFYYFTYRQKYNKNIFYIVTINDNDNKISSMLEYYDNLKDYWYISISFITTIKYYRNLWLATKLLDTFFNKFKNNEKVSSYFTSNWKSYLEHKYQEMCIKYDTNIRCSYQWNFYQINAW